MRGNGILTVSIQVEEVDGQGNRTQKKVVLNEDFNVPIDSDAMHAYDALATKYIGPALYQWGDDVRMAQTDSK